jgi:chromosome partitioning protein
MARVIAIANQKGGVGKTTTTINLGVVLAQMQKQVLAVDLDPQAALTAGLGLDAYELGETIYTGLTSEGFLIDRVVRSVRAHLDLIPANIDLAAAEMELIGELRREFVLKRILTPLYSRYDLVLIDCPPSLGMLTTNALCACGEVLIPMQCEYFAMRGIRLLLDVIRRIKTRLNPSIELLGIVPTMYATGTIHAQEVLSEIRAIFGEKVFDTVIHKSIRFAEASVANEAMGEYSSKHKGAIAYAELARQLVGRN